MCGGTLNLLRAASSPCGCILSNAFSQSKRTVYEDCPVASARSISLRMMCAGCEVDLAALKPNCVSRSQSSMAACSRPWRILAKSL